MYFCVYSQEKLIRWWFSDIDRVLSAIDSASIPSGSMHVICLVRVQGHEECVKIYMHISSKHFITQRKSADRQQAGEEEMHLLLAGEDTGEESSDQH